MERLVLVDVGLEVGWLYALESCPPELGCLIRLCSSSVASSPQD